MAVSLETKTAARDLGVTVVKGGEFYITVFHVHLSDS